MRLDLPGGSFVPADFHAVIFRRPTPFSPDVAGDDWQRKHAADEWAEAVEGFLAHIPVARWINHPTRNYLASHKIHQLRLAHRHGLIVPPWLVTTDPNAAERFIRDCGGSAIVKPLASGYIERDEQNRDTVIYTNLITQNDAQILERVATCPVLFQRCVTKRADVRLVYLDGRMIAIEMLASDGQGTQRLDIRRFEMVDVTYSRLTIPQETATGVSILMQSYGLRFAALDFAVDVKGNWVFFEINPNGQWAWLDQVGACDAAQLFVEVLSA